MAGNFEDAMAAADAAIDAAFGEPFLVEPVASAAADDGDVNGTARADFGRATVRAIMTFHEAGQVYFPQARATAANTAQRTVGAELKVSVMRHSLPWEPRPNDLLHRQKTGVTYRVAKVEPDDAGRIWMPVIVERAR
ncbi:hypothetical protein MMB17_07475 [Methylobacterium organophilum]|uniref:hypothetical protein n=1 Tax=Methylobacterium organophilum TaxID=410 RepID=UPI001F142DE6|nr:hypothetical protein [Methylobacterium organophilum]UMY19130.1 hypothetical protein MMB17_07475 [Methylobacterium organophilum]